MVYLIIWQRARETCLNVTGNYECRKNRQYKFGIKLSLNCLDLVSDSEDCIQSDDISIVNVNQIGCQVQ